MERNISKPTIFAVVLLLGGATAAWASHIISATQDLNGAQHAATYNVKSVVTVTCTRATQSAPLKAGSSRPACYVAGPGLGKKVEINSSVATSGAGTLTVTCTGQGQLGCSVRIND
jgi:hypothetical protein